MTHLLTQELKHGQFSRGKDELRVSIVDIDRKDRISHILGQIHVLVPDFAY